MKQPLIIGTRGSDLALKQTEMVCALLKGLEPELELKVRVIKTTGDEKLSAPFTQMVGKGFFTKEIESFLLKQEIDFAVHSLKDLPTEEVPGLKVAAYLERESPEDVLVAESVRSLADLPKGAVIGTSSPRRHAWLRQMRPDCQVQPIRGNIQTRLNKVFGRDLKKKEEKVDAAVLAYAGLKRLHLTEPVSEIFCATDFVPAPGQGVLAVQCRQQDEALLALLQRLNHAGTETAILAERSFLSCWGGGCSVPLGAYAGLEKETLCLTGALYLENKATVYKEQITGSLDKPELLGQKLAERFKSL